MTFEGAVAATPDLHGAWRDGLGALRRADKEHVGGAVSRLLSGSVNVDTALTKNYPNAYGWDYGIGNRPTNLGEEVVYWVEVHPAGRDGDVKVVLAKLAWLKTWLRRKRDAAWLDAKELYLGLQRQHHVHTEFAATEAVRLTGSPANGWAFPGSRHVRSLRREHEHLRPPFPGPCRLPRLRAVLLHHRRRPNKAGEEGNIFNDTTQD